MGVEQKVDARLVFALRAQTLEEEIGILAWMAKEEQICAETSDRIKRDGIGREIRKKLQYPNTFQRLYERVVSPDKNKPIKYRLFHLTNSQVQTLGRIGFLGSLKEGRPERQIGKDTSISPDSILTRVFKGTDSLDTFDLCSYQGEACLEARHLVAIKRKPYNGEGIREKCWVIGWVTGSELRELTSSES